MEKIEQKYISLREAAKYSGCYSQDYLSLRARQGKLKALKLGRNWVTKKKWIDEYLEKTGRKKVKFKKRKIYQPREKKEEIEEIEVRVLKEEPISLKEAAKYSGYSQDYLSLRARQGKLKALKLGRNWVTKKKWIDEYLEKVRDYNQKIKKEREGREEFKIEISKSTPSFSFTSSPGSGAQFTALLVALVFIFGSLAILFSYPYFLPILNSSGYLAGQTAKEIVSDLKEFRSEIERNIIETQEDISQNLANLTTNIYFRTNSLLLEFSKNLKIFPKSLTLKIREQASEKGEGIYQFGKKFKGKELKALGAKISKTIKESFLLEVKHSLIHFLIEISKKFTQYLRQDIQSLQKISRDFYQRLSAKISQAVQMISQLRKEEKKVREKIKGFSENLIYGIIKKLPRKIGALFEKEKPYEEILFKLNQEGQEGLVIISSTKKGEKELEEIKKKIMASFSDKLELIPKNTEFKIFLPLSDKNQQYLPVFILIYPKEIFK